jgi:hypothetical protein
MPLRVAKGARSCKPRCAARAGDLSENFQASFRTRAQDAAAMACPVGPRKDRHEVPESRPAAGSLPSSLLRPPVQTSVGAKVLWRMRWRGAGRRCDRPRAGRPHRPRSGLPMKAVNVMLVAAVLLAQPLVVMPAASSVLESAAPAGSMLRRLPIGQQRPLARHRQRRGRDRSPGAPRRKPSTAFRRAQRKASAGSTACSPAR